MTEMSLIRPRDAVLLTDLVFYLLALHHRYPALAERVRQAIEQGRYYEQN